MVDLGAMAPSQSQQRMGPPAARGTKRKARDGPEAEDSGTVPDLPLRQAKQRKVVVYRKYREGELPDIQVGSGLSSPFCPHQASELGVVVSSVLTPRIISWVRCNRSHAVTCCGRCKGCVLGTSQWPRAC